VLAAPGVGKCVRSPLTRVFDPFDSPSGLIRIEQPAARPY
jgi:hypothetical protein